MLLGFILATAIILSACAAIWFAFAYGARVSESRRGFAAIFLPSVGFAIFLWIEGSMLNGVFALLFLPPMILLCIPLVLWLERIAAPNPND